MDPDEVVVLEWHWMSLQLRASTISARLRCPVCSPKVWSTFRRLQIGGVRMWPLMVSSVFPTYPFRYLIFCSAAIVTRVICSLSQCSDLGGKFLRIFAPTLVQLLRKLTGNSSTTTAKFCRMIMAKFCGYCWVSKNLTTDRNQSDVNKTKRFVLLIIIGLQNFHWSLMLLSKSFGSLVFTTSVFILVYLSVQCFCWFFWRAYRHRNALYHNVRACSPLATSYRPFKITEGPPGVEICPVVNRSTRDKRGANEGDGGTTILTSSAVFVHCTATMRPVYYDNTTGIDTSRRDFAFSVFSLLFTLDLCIWQPLSIEPTNQAQNCDNWSPYSENVFGRTLFKNRCPHFSSASFYLFLNGNPVTTSSSEKFWIE